MTTELDGLVRGAEPDDRRPLHGHRGRRRLARARRSNDIHHDPAGPDPADLRAFAPRRRPRPRSGDDRRHRAPASAPRSSRSAPAPRSTPQVMQNAPSFNRDIRDIIRMDPRVSLDREDAATSGSGQDRISLPRRQRPQQHLHRRRHSAERRLRPQRHRLLVAQLDPDSLRRGPRDAGPVRSVRRRIWQLHGLRDQRRHQVAAPTASTAAPSTNSRTTACAATRSRQPRRRADRARQALGRFARRPDHQGPPVLLRRLRAPEGGPVAGRRPDRRRLRQRSPRRQRRAVQRDLAGPHDVYGVDTGPLVHNRPFKNERLFGRVDWQITDAHRLEATYQRLKEIDAEERRPVHRLSPQRRRREHLLPERHRFEILLGAVSIRTGPTASRPSFATRTRTSRTSRTRSAAAKRSRATRSRESSSASTIRRSGQLVEPVPPDATVLAGPGISRSANDLKTKLDLFRGVANTMRRPQAEGRRRGQPREIFNLFVQNATGTLVFQQLTDLRNGLLSPDREPTHTSRTTSSSGVAAGAFGNFTDSGDVNDARRAVQADDLFALRAGRLAA